MNRSAVLHPRALLRLTALATAACAIATPAAHAGKVNLVMNAVGATGAYGAVAEPGEIIRLSAEIANPGPFAVGNAYIGFVLRTDSTTKVMPSKYQAVSIAWWEPFSTKRISFDWRVPGEEIGYRTYWLWSCVDIDRRIAETVETDNCRATPLQVVPDSSVPGLDPKRR